MSILQPLRNVIRMLFLALMESCHKIIWPLFDTEQIFWQGWYNHWYGEGCWQLKEKNNLISRNNPKTPELLIPKSRLSA